MTTGPDAEAAVVAVADRLFAAIEAGDAAAVAALYADDAEVWHSVTQRTVDRASSLRILEWLMAPGVTRDYDVHERIVHGDRLVQRHTLRVTVPGHDVVVVPASIFLTVVDGRIRRIDEYTDRAATDTLIEIVPRT